jgi:hypothetical protein
MIPDSPLVAPQPVCFWQILTCARHYRVGQGSPAIRAVLALLADESADTAIYYAIIAVGIAAAITAAAQGICPSSPPHFLASAPD